ncbi:exonuclease 1 [Nematocida sp. AWRm77]|nr:exonuclease 1 [Nematocida sp. AWRm77]
MGIPGLLPMIKEHLVYTEVSSLKGATVGVDGYSWLYKAASTYAVDLYTSPESEAVVRKYTQFCIRKCKALQSNGIRLYFVFDGEEHPMKAETSRKRREKKEEVRAKIEQLLKRGKKKEAQALMGRCVKVGRSMVDRLVEELDILGIPHVTAPYEADPQLAYLEREGHIDYITTEDSDLIVYGAKRVLFKLVETQGADLFDREKILQSSAESIKHLLEHTKEIVALSGCDYTEGIRKIGLLTSHRLMMIHRTVEACIDHLSKKSFETDGHLEACKRVVRTFCHHVVMDPVTKERRYLLDLEDSQEESNASALEDMSFVGVLSDPREKAQELLQTPSVV